MHCDCTHTGSRGNLILHLRKGRVLETDLESVVTAPRLQVHDLHPGNMGRPRSDIQIIEKGAYRFLLALDLDLHRPIPTVLHVSRKIEAPCEMKREISESHTLYDSRYDNADPNHRFPPFGSGPPATGRNIPRQAGTCYEYITCVFR